MPAEQILFLKNPKEDINSFLLFIETAQRLREAVEKLPKLSLRAKLLLMIPADEVGGSSSVEELVSSADSVSPELDLPNLSEAQFEQLALRFRPFMLNNEKVNFEYIVNLLNARNPDMRAHLAPYSKRWEQAIFWGAIGLSHFEHSDKQLTADELIGCGFYSQYFHLNLEKRARALRMKAALGVDRYWAALVSSVWARAQVVVDLSKALRIVLIAQGYATEDQLRAIEAPTGYPKEERVILRLGSGKANLKKLANGAKETS